LTLGLAGLMACREITLSPDRVIALEVGDPAPRVEEGDTARLVARALNAAGRPVEGATVTWAVVDTGTIGFELEPSGLVRANTPGSAARVQASSDNLRSDPITVTVTAIPDTSAATGPTRVVVPPSDVQSAPLGVTVYDRAATGQLSGIIGKSVIFETTEPAGSTGFFLTATDTVPGPDPHRVVAQTASNGLASVRARRRAGQAAPDSALISATAVNARGVTVPGTPVRFVVVFQNP
jgi:hypothetical protein